MNDFAQMKEIADELINIQRTLPDILHANKITIRSICKKTGIAYSTFFRSVKNQSFTAGELKSIFEAINKRR